MSQIDLELAAARIAFLTRSERLLVARSLDRAADLSVLSIAELERLVGRRLLRCVWKPGDFLALAVSDRERAEKYGIEFVTYSSQRYPPLLRELPDPPVALFFRGVLSDPEKPVAAVVGTRKPSAEGARLAYEFGRDFARCGVCVVSGLALGIDAMAHRGAVDGGAPTIAVLGSGLDNVYPRSNRALARRIVEGGGALVGEYPPGEPPYKSHFPERNRIIAGLSRAMVVVEAPVRSGALISAEFALEQGRDLWVAASCLEGESGAGTRALAGDGAPVASSAFDVVAEWGFPVPAVSPMKNARPPRLPFRTAAARSLETELQFGTEAFRSDRRLGGVH